MQEVDISKLTIAELKSLGFDQQISIQKLEIQLGTLRDSYDVILRRINAMLAEEQAATQASRSNEVDKAVAVDKKKRVRPSRSKK